MLKSELVKIERPESKQPMPDHAKKVFSGILFDVYQWEQEQFDGSFKTFEKLKRPDTVITFPVTTDGKIILTKQEQPGKYHFIGGAGGRVDPGEDALTAAKRELLEETGYGAKKLVLIKAIQPSSKVDHAVFIFIAKGCKKVAEMSLDSGEKIELMPVSFEEFMELALRDDFAETEVVRMIFEAHMDSEKMEELRKLFTV